MKTKRPYYQATPKELEAIGVAIDNLIGMCGGGHLELDNQSRRANKALKAIIKRYEPLGSSVKMKKGASRMEKPIIFNAENDSAFDDAEITAVSLKDEISKEESHE